jgi:hypothetical protein
VTGVAGEDVSCLDKQTNRKGGDFATGRTRSAVGVWRSTWPRISHNGGHPNPVKLSLSGKA